MFHQSSVWKTTEIKTLWVGLEGSERTIHRGEFSLHHYYKHKTFDEKMLLISALCLTVSSITFILYNNPSLKNLKTWVGIFRVGVFLIPEKPYYIKDVQKQPFADVLQNKCSWKFCRIHEKTLVLESFFNKVAGLKRPQHKCFPMIFAKFSRAPYNKTPYTIKIANGLSKSTILYQIKQ